MSIKTKPILKIQTTSHYKKSYTRLSFKIQKQADKKIMMFKQNPYHASLKTHQLSGKLKTLKSFALNQDYRILFQFIDSDKAIFFDIGTHQIYK